MEDSIDALCPLDGRYKRRVKSLSDYFSERAFMRYRILVTIEYLIFLSEHPKSDIELNDEEKNRVRKLYNLTKKDSLTIKKIETEGCILNGVEIPKTNHDYKAIEYYIKAKLKEMGMDEKTVQHIHIGLTTWDPTNIATALMLRDSVKEVMIPKLEDIFDVLAEYLKEYHGTVMLGKTHGQPAVPTTLGKELRVYYDGLKTELNKLKSLKLGVKFSGACGTYAGQMAAYPEIDWIEFGRDFVDSFNKVGYIRLELEPVATQIPSYNTHAELFQTFIRIDNMLKNLAEDMWLYINEGWLKLKIDKREIGSSTMPQKVNPIDFENAEGNFKISVPFYELLVNTLPISRQQRDLSNSTIERNVGTAFGYSLGGYTSLLRGLGKIDPDEEKMLDDLRKHPEVLAESYQQRLRRYGIDIYKEMKDFTRGKKITIEELKNFINNLDIPEEIKEDLKEIRPEDYIGLSKELALMK